uniref:Afamin n=1 Tax=Oryctolagus cuniculus TaxID=9986 RepID=G1SHH2_RABIT
MKQLNLAGIVFFSLFLIASLILPTKPQDVDDFSVTQKFIEENAGYLTIIAFAQYVQEATFEEVQMLMKDMLEYKDKCLADKTLPECAETANNILQEKICAMEGLSQRHNFSHCCSKVDFERRLCFFYNKKADVGFLPPFLTLDPEEKCQAYKNSRDSFLNHYIYEVARRNPFAFAPTLLTVAAQFEELTNRCCEEQHKASCFGVRAAPVTQYLKAMSSYQKNVCGAFLKFGSNVLNSMIVGADPTISPEFSKCSYRLHRRISCLIKICVCKTKETLLSSAKNSPRLGLRNLLPSLKMFLPRMMDAVKGMLYIAPTAWFLYEYARRHQDLSIVELLRIAEVYKNLMENCCSTENPLNCYHSVEEKFNETTEKSLKMVQQECKRFQNLGKDGLKYHYLIKLTKTAPQLSTEELLSLGQEMVMALSTCCTLSEEFACVDNLMDLVLGELCGIKENRTINPAVDHCCQTNFAFRRPCFEGLKADQTYVPPPTSQDFFAFPLDWCQDQKEELQRKKDRFLVNLVKLKPELPDEELQSLFTNFTDTLEKCCNAKGPEACFNQEHLKIGD